MEVVGRGGGGLKRREWGEGEVEEEMKGGREEGRGKEAAEVSGEDGEQR